MSGEFIVCGNFTYRKFADEFYEVYKKYIYILLLKWMTMTMTLLSLLRLEAVKTCKHVSKAAMFFYVNNT